LNGLTANWVKDSRVERVLAAVPERDIALPEGVELLAMKNGGGWIKHLTHDLPKAADACRADVIFCTNATGPRDSRTVLYFQDLFHFHRFEGFLPLRGQLFESGRALWRKFVAPHCGLGIAVSHLIAEEAKRDVGKLPVVEIPNGVDTDSFRWNGEEDTVYVTGGTGSHKSEETALQAWARLVRRRLPAAVLEIGGVEPATRRADLVRVANDLQLGETVVIQGALPREVYLERIARARLVISCSRLESFGLPVAEAIAMGAPVLCSDISAHRELVGRGGVGETFPAGDHDALATRLRTALDGDLPRRLTSPPLGWTWKTRASEHIDAYQSYLSA
jgi:glycosyltransferase involved in cell wall biosynthesis